MTQSLHILAQPPSVWRSTISARESLINQYDGLLLLGYACANHHSQPMILLDDLHAKYKLKIYILASDTEYYGISISALMDHIRVISHHDWLVYCQKADRIITW